MTGFSTKGVLLCAASASLMLFASGAAVAQSGADWSGGYSFPSANEAAVRLGTVDQIAKVESGYYDRVGTTTYYTYNNNDSSVGDIYVDAADGATVDASVRTAEGSGTNTYVVGAVNTSNNQIEISGDGNALDITSAADNDGCQDGRISVTGTTFGAGGTLADITGGTAANSTVEAATCK